MPHSRSSCKFVSKHQFRNLMRVYQLLIFILAISNSYKCTSDRKISSQLTGTWQAQSITISSIKLDIFNDSLSLPAEYYKERIGVNPGSSEYTFDSLILVGLKDEFKNSLMANQIEFTKTGHFKFKPRSGDVQEGTYQFVSKNQMQLAVSNDTNNVKPVFYFDVNNDLLHLTLTGEKEIEAVYKRIM